MNEDQKNVEAHVKELEALALAGDEMAIKTLATMVLINE